MGIRRSHNYFLPICGTSSDISQARAPRVIDKILAAAGDRIMPAIAKDNIASRQATGDIFRSAATEMESSGEAPWTLKAGRVNVLTASKGLDRNTRSINPTQNSLRGHQSLATWTLRVQVWGNDECPIVKRITGVGHLLLGFISVVRRHAEVQLLVLGYFGKILLGRSCIRSLDEAVSVPLREIPTISEGGSTFHKCFSVVCQGIGSVVSCGTPASSIDVVRSRHHMPMIPGPWRKCLSLS